MGKSKDLATGNSAAYVETAGDTMSGALNVGTASGTQPSYFNSFLNVQNNASTSDHASVTITSGTGGYAGLHFGDSANGRIGQVAYNNADDSLLFTAGNSTRMTINSSGHVTMPNQPKFKVRRNSSSVTLTGNNAKQNLVFNVEDFDIGGGYNTTTGKYTVPATGVYFFFLNPRFDGITSSTYARALIYKGASIPSSPWSDYGNVLSSIDGDNHSTNYHTLNVSGIFSCVAGDVINFLGGGQFDSSITLQAESQAGGFMIG
jgi:hypothetical protein